MPNVTATPKGLLNGEVVTEFTDVTSTSSVTYTYPVQQAGISIENSGVADIFVTVGAITNQVVHPDKKWRADVPFTSFSIRSDMNSQEFIATSFQNGSAGETATLGNELVDGIGWTFAGWTGSFAAGFAHTAGQTTPLSRSIGATGTKVYEVSFRITSPTSAWNMTVSIGGSVPFEIYTGGSTVTDYTVAVQSVSDGELQFIPDSTFDGTVSNISVKEVTAGYNATTIIKDSSGNNSMEIRNNLERKNNTFIGRDSGLTNSSGYGNTGIGVETLNKNVGGFWNSAVGFEALKNNVGGSRNTAIGYNALADNISGQRNAAIGTFALVRNTTGYRNIAIGSDPLFFNTTGYENVAIGSATLYNNVTGNSNVAVGLNALYETTGSSNVALGNNAAYHNSSGSANLAIGKNALYNNKTGSNNIAIGQSAGLGVSGSTVSSNVIIGNNAGNAITTGANNNVMVGFATGQSITTGSGNTFIGNNAGTNASQLASAANSIAIGKDAYTTKNNQVVLGGATVTEVTTPGALLPLLGYKSADGSAGVSGSYTTADAKTVTVKNGIITAIV